MTTPHNLLKLMYLGIMIKDNHLVSSEVRLAREEIVVARPFVHVVFWPEKYTFGLCTYTIFWPKNYIIF